MTGPGALRCAAHPDTETSLRCGKCGQPICPKCMVQTPVGARCRECARLNKPPTYRVSGPYYLRAGGTALGVAIITGLIWGFVHHYLGGYSLIISVVFGYVVGYVVAEVTGLAINRKRGRWLAVIGAVAVIICFVTAGMVDFFRFGYFYLGGFMNLFTLVAVAVGIYFAVNRLR